MKKHSAFTLTELLISLFLATLLSTILIQLYLLNKSHYKKLHTALKIRFEIQWAKDLIADSIRRAGFTPCLPVDYLNIIDQRRPSKPHKIHAISTNHTEINISRMHERFGELVTISPSQELLVTAKTQIRSGQSILISNCKHGEVHKINILRRNSQGIWLGLDRPLNFRFQGPTYVGEWLEERWFIQENPKAKNALYYQQRHSEELTPYIQAMEIKTYPKYLHIFWKLADNSSYDFKVTIRS